MMYDPSTRDPCQNIPEVCPEQFKNWTKANEGKYAAASLSDERPLSLKFCFKHELLVSSSTQLKAGSHLSGRGTPRKLFEQLQRLPNGGHTTRGNGSSKILLAMSPLICILYSTN